jgi:hypothetical protein
LPLILIDGSAGAIGLVPDETDGGFGGAVAAKAY